MRLILASKSPRRQQLLRNAGFDFRAQPSSVAEARREGEMPEQFAVRMAREKSLDVAACSPAGSLVLGADTVVVIDGEVLGKPVDAGDAARILRRLSGCTHRVITSRS